MHCHDIHRKKYHTLKKKKEEKTLVYLAGLEPVNRGQGEHSFAFWNILYVSHDSLEGVPCFLLLLKGPKQNWQFKSFCKTCVWSVCKFYMDILGSWLHNRGYNRETTIALRYSTARLTRPRDFATCDPEAIKTYPYSFRWFFSTSS